MIVIITIITYFFISINPQLTAELYIGNQQLTMYSNQSTQPLFDDYSIPLDCSFQMYAYSQTQTEYQRNQPYYVILRNNSNNLKLAISTQYNHFNPSLNTSICNAAFCNISIANNCASQLTNQNYYDIISLNIAPIATFTYTVQCNQSFININYDLGRLIIILMVTIILIFAVNFATLRAFDGIAFQYNIKWISLISLSMLTVGLFGLFLPTVGEIIVEIASFLAIFVCCSLIFIEFLYYLNFRILTKYIEIKTFKIRILDVIGLILSIPVACGWWFSHKNWIISNFISTCIIISFIKVFKITSFKIGLLAYGILFILYIISAILPFLTNKPDVNFFFIFAFNTPFQIQAPVILPTFRVKCSWISVTTVCFPGIIISYLRRFDHSRNTNIYLITSVISYFVGSIVWWIVNVFSQYPIPFSAFCQPIMIITFSIFAFKRKELRTIWQGKFYDEQFVNKEDIDQIGQRLSKQEEIVEDTNLFRDRLTNKSYFFNMNEDSELQAGIRQNQIGIKIKNDEL